LPFEGSIAELRGEQPKNLRSVFASNSGLRNSGHRRFVSQDITITPAKQLKKYVSDLETQNVVQLSQKMSNKVYHHQIRPTRFQLMAKDGVIDR